MVPFGTAWRGVVAWEEGNSHVIPLGRGTLESSCTSTVPYACSAIFEHRFRVPAVWSKSLGRILQKNQFAPGSAPDPAGELTALPRLPSWWGRGSLPPPQPQEPHTTPTSTLGLLTSNCGLAGKHITTTLCCKIAPMAEVVNAHC